MRLLDRFFDLTYEQHAGRRSTDKLRPEGTGDRFGETRARERAAHRLRLARGQSRRRPVGGRRARSRSPTAPRRRRLFYADWVEEIGDERPRLAAYRARLLAHPVVARAVDEARPYRHYFPLGAPDRD